MPSPFPGMDPFIEANGLWEGFHNRLIHKIDETLAQVLPQGYSIDTGTRSYIILVESQGRTASLAKADVTIIEASPGRKGRGKSGGLAVAEPAESDESVPMEAYISKEFQETFVEIYAEQEERRLVTCIEVLSPSNKRPGTEGWDLYQRKRQAFFQGRANFLEIDLLRDGRKHAMLTPWPKSPYTLLVSRARKAPSCRVWLGHYRRRLPVIPVPLLATTPDLSLDLQPLIDGIYALGRYHERIDYARPLTPPLRGAEAEYVRKLLKNR